MNIKHRGTEGGNTQRDTWTNSRHEGTEIREQNRECRTQSEYISWLYTKSLYWI